MKIVEIIHKFKKDVNRKIKAFYRDYFTVDGIYTSLLPDKIYLKKLYKKKTGKELDLHNPKTFTEKGNWLKLYNRRPEYTVMVDKYKAREYISRRIGEKYLVPLLGVWSSPDEIDFESLPNEFVLKCNHDSDVVICRDKNSNDFRCKKGKINSVDEVKAYLSKRIGLNYYKASREWPYKDVPRKIICEKFMKNTNNEELHDYKLFCFNGKVKLIEVNSERFSDLCKEDHFDIDWNHYDITGKLSWGKEIEKPIFFDEMVSIAELFSQNIPFLRVDFNCWDGNLYVGEFTFFYSGAMQLFKEPWETILGEWIMLPKKKHRSR